MQRGAQDWVAGYSESGLAVIAVVLAINRKAIDPNRLRNGLEHKDLVISGLPLRLGIAAALGVAALLSGCDDKSDIPPSGNGLNSPALVEALSSKSRNCEAVPTKGQLMSNDSVPLDTRIIAIGDVTLFVPVDWLRGYLVDDVKAGSVSPNSFETFIGKFAPDLRRNECPGIVHRFAVGERTSRYGAMALRTTALPPSVMTSRGEQLPRVKEVIIGAQQDATPRPTDAYRASLPVGQWTKVRSFPTYKMPDGSPAHGLCTATQGTPSSEWVISRYITPTVNVGFVIGVLASEPSSGWAPYCEALFPLFKWLTAIPSNRLAEPTDAPTDDKII